MFFFPGFLAEVLFAERDQPKMGSVKEEPRNASSIARPSTNGRVEAKHTGDSCAVNGWCQ